MDSEATVAHTTGVFEALRRDPAIGPAETLRQSMLAPIYDPNRSACAYPRFRASVGVVGEG